MRLPWPKRKSISSVSRPSYSTRTLLTDDSRQVLPFLTSDILFTPVMSAAPVGNAGRTGQRALPGLFFRRLWLAVHLHTNGPADTCSSAAAPCRRLRDAGEVHRPRLPRS